MIKSFYVDNPPIWTRCPARASRRHDIGSTTFRTDSQPNPLDIRSFRYTSLRSRSPPRLRHRMLSGKATLVESRLSSDHRHSMIRARDASTIGPTQESPLSTVGSLPGLRSCFGPGAPHRGPFFKPLTTGSSSRHIAPLAFCLLLSINQKPTTRTSRTISSTVGRQHSTNNKQRAL